MPARPRIPSNLWERLKTEVEDGALADEYATPTEATRDGIRQLLRGDDA